MTRRKFTALALAGVCTGLAMGKKGKATLSTNHEVVIEVRVQYTTEDDEPLSEGHQNQVASAAVQGAAAKVSELGGEVQPGASGVIREG